MLMGMSCVNVTKITKGIIFLCCKCCWIWLLLLIPISYWCFSAGTFRKAIYIMQDSHLTNVVKILIITFAWPICIHFSCFFFLNYNRKFECLTFPSFMSVRHIIFALRLCYNKYYLVKHIYSLFFFKLRRVFYIFYFFHEDIFN